MFVGDPGSAAYPYGPWGRAVTQRHVCVPQYPAQSCDTGAAYKDYALMAVNPIRGIENYTFAHELGHVLGSEHDRAGTAGQDYVDWSPTPSSSPRSSYAFSFGYRAGSGGPLVGTTGRADVMTSPECIPSNSTSNCWQRLPQFADPNRTFSGLGVPSGQVDPVGNNSVGYGQNAKTFRTLIEEVASFYGNPPLEQPFFWDGFES